MFHENILLELFLSSLTLVANLSDSNIQPLQVVIQRTPLLEALTGAASHRVCNGKLLAALVYLASVLGYHRRGLGLTKQDQVRLC